MQEEIVQGCLSLDFPFSGRACGPLYELRKDWSEDRVIYLVNHRNGDTVGNILHFFHLAVLITRFSPGTKLDATKIESLRE